ncbi:Mariner Mos1 transposase [Araneus ventricosus]|uniref:Mariner Mos1 transposase n=1 Tax=Araneus ventricosus TaxID=182803 RepID=A0A4Y2FIH8_ARAVE|nr:Mariner Mos1 transposase [Araneus ventricosus]
MCESLGINTVSCDTVKVWFWKFKAGNFDIEDNHVLAALLKLIFNRWVPHELTAEDKRKRKAACFVLLRDQRKEKTLDRIVTCDEKWVYYNNTSRKGGWSAPGESAGSVERRALINKKVLLCICWDCRRIIYKEYLKS